MNKFKTIITIAVISLSLGGLAYAKNDKEKKLPPGLEKKVESGKSLPPGWQKKLAVGETLDEGVYKHGKIVATDSDKGLIMISAEGKLIKVIENTREIIEIMEGF